LSSHISANRLAALRRLLEVVADLEEALDEPRLAIEAVVGQDRFGPRRGGRRSRQQRRAAAEDEITSGRHFFTIARRWR
jgi:hypothetical protein